MSQHLFTNVNVLDCTGKEPFAGEVRVKTTKSLPLLAMAKHSTVTARRSTTAKAA